MINQNVYKIPFQKQSNMKSNIHLPNSAPSASTTVFIFKNFSIKLGVAKVTSQSICPHQKHRKT